MWNCNSYRRHRKIDPQIQRRYPSTPHTYVYGFDATALMCNANVFDSIQFHSIAFAIPPISFASAANSNIYTHAQASHTWKRPAADLHGWGWIFQFILVRNCSTAHNGKVAAVFADASTAHWESCRVPPTPCTSPGAPTPCTCWMSVGAIAPLAIILI